MQSISTVIYIVVSASAICLGLGYLLRVVHTALRKAQIDSLVRTRLRKAKKQADKIVIEAYDQVSELRNDLQTREQLLIADRLDIDNEKQRINDSKQILDSKIKKADEIINNYQVALSSIARDHEINPEIIKQELKLHIDQNLSDYYDSKLKNLNNAYQDKLEELIIKHLPDITRLTVRNNTSTTLQVSSSEIGKVIGRDGVNIKALERYGGIDIVIDDQENTVTISSFDPKRRFIAKRALVELLEDGRVDRHTIQEKLADVEQRIKTESLDLLDRGLRQLELDTVITDKELRESLSSLYFRHSYGQNQLEHALETADIAGKIGAEFNLEIPAKIAGLLHDIGKTSTDSTDHIKTGLELIKKHADNIVSAQMVTAISEHHNDHATTLLSAIIQTADAVSSARPGARNQSTTSYFNRLENIEKFINNYKTVDNAYVIKGGREVYIIVRAQDFSQSSLTQLGNMIAHDLKESGLIHQPISLRLVREDEIVKNVA